MARTRHWWVCANQPADGGWHWERYFRNPSDGLQWGGAGWIRSATSRSRIETMRRGDFVICYQGGEGVVGFARLKSNGYKSPGSDHHDMFDLRRAPSLRLDNPVPLSVVKALPHAPHLFEFVRSGRGTVFGVETGGFERIVALAIAFNPELSSRLIKLGL